MNFHLMAIEKAGGYLPAFFCYMEKLDIFVKNAMPPAIDEQTAIIFPGDRHMLIIVPFALVYMCGFFCQTEEITVYFS